MLQNFARIKVKVKAGILLNNIKWNPASNMWASLVVEKPESTTLALSKFQFDAG